MKVKISIVLLLVVLSFSAIAQKKENRTIHSKEFVEEVNFLNKSMVFLTNPYKMYFWMEAGKIHKTQGDYKGKLLHGKYEKCDQSGNLIEKGKYRKGLKVGEWKKWNVDGKLKQISHWKTGVLDGELLSFENGDLRSILHFKNGRKHGHELKLIDGKLAIVGKYKNGVFLENPLPEKEKDNPDNSETKVSDSDKIDKLDKTEKDGDKAKVKSPKKKQK